MNSVLDTNITSLKIFKEVEIDASAERVFEVLTNEVSMWWGEPYLRNFKSESLILEARLGGKFYETWKNGGMILGEVIEFNYPDKIVNVIVSRRTPIKLLKYLEDNNFTPSSNISEAYYTSSIVIITDDSYCMISEAVQSGVVPLVIRTQNLNERMKSGIHYLHKEGYIDYIDENKPLNMRFQNKNILDIINIKDIL